MKYKINLNDSGLQVSFNKKMEPEMHGKVARKEKDYWKFEGKDPTKKYLNWRNALKLQIIKMGIHQLPGLSNW